MSFSVRCIFRLNPTIVLHISILVAWFCRVSIYYGCVSVCMGRDGEYTHYSEEMTGKQKHLQNYNRLYHTLYFTKEARKSKFKGLTFILSIYLTVERILSLCIFFFLLEHTTKPAHWIFPAILFFFFVDLVRIRTQAYQVQFVSDEKNEDVVKTCVDMIRL